MVKAKPESGLGINLLSTVGGDDSAVEMPSRHFIGKILPEGPVAKTGVIHVDDELLAVSVCLYSLLIIMMMNYCTSCHLGRFAPPQTSLNRWPLLELVSQIKFLSWVLS